MYENCEKNFAFIRIDNSEDGIYYSSSDLNCKDLFFQVLFENLKDEYHSRMGLIPFSNIIFYVKEYLKPSTKPHR